MNKPLLGFVSLCAIACSLGIPAIMAQSNDTPRLSEMAKPRAIPPGAPKPGDVVMRSLFPRPMNANDPHDTLEAIKGFHVTRLEWTYGDQADFIKKVHDLGVWYGGAASAGNYLGEVPHEKWNVVNLNGEPMYATWMRKWAKPNAWGCANNPEFRAGHLRKVCATIDAGADGLQRDEPVQNKLALNWGACFCDYCMKGFREYLKTKGDVAQLQALGVTDLNSFDYRVYLKAKNAPVGDAFNGWKGDDLKTAFYKFQSESTIEFNQWWRSELNKHAGHPVSVSCNNGVHDWSDIEMVFDFCIGELSAGDARPEFLYYAMRKATELGRSQIVTMPLRSNPKETPEWVLQTRQTIATVYATGGNIEAPWDTYLPTPQGDRYFGKPEQYADVLGFVRAMAERLNDHEDAFATGGKLDDARWKGKAPALTISQGSDGVYAFVRAIPRKNDAPLVVHLIDWKKSPAPFTLSLNPLAFFGETPVHLRLYTPVAYNKEAHGRAFASKDYSKLVAVTDLGQGYLSSVKIPALSPWGILVVEPATERIAGIWPPTIFSNDAGFYEKAVLNLGCATPGAQIYYTLDGSKPAERSSRFTVPVELNATTRVLASALANGSWSAVSEAQFVKREKSVINLIKNGELDNGIKDWKKIIRPGLSPSALDASVDTSGKLSGKNSAKLVVKEPTGTVYHLRFAQPFRVQENGVYFLTYRAKADGPTKCRVGMQGANPPHTVIGMGEETFDTESKTYILTGVSYTDQPFEALVQFDLGGAEKGRTVWIDEVCLEQTF